MNNIEEETKSPPVQDDEYEYEYYSETTHNEMENTSKNIYQIEDDVPKLDPKKDEMETPNKISVNLNEIQAPRLPK